MTTPTSGSTFSIVQASGNADIDALISTYRWGVSSSSPTVITYSFPVVGSLFSTDSTSGYGPSSGTGEPWHGYYPLTSYEQQQVRAVLQSISNVANIVFQEVPDNATTVGDIRYAFSSSLPASAYAWAHLPVGTYNTATRVGSAFESSGDVWIRAAAYTAFNPVPGSYDYETLIHETLHALGLKHPFEPDQSGVVLTSDRDIVPMTVMSYSELEGANTSMSVYPSQPMPLDIEALQYLYGANIHFTEGANTYSISTATPTWMDIYDTGGTDTIAINGSLGVHLDLRPNSWSQINAGITAGNGRIYPNTLYIEQQTVIENATGGSGNDTITGNDANNSISGGAGNDILYGGAGNDTFDWDPNSRAGTDTFYGGLGDDIYVVDNSGDAIVENSGEGVDTIWTSIHFMMVNAPNVENLRIFGSGNISAVGNILSNDIRGNDGNNVIAGAGGSDTLTGGAGNDDLDGGTGVDTSIYSGNRASKTVTKTSTGYTVSGSTDGTDTLFAIERFSFADKKIALDLDGAAGTTAKILGAVFGTGTLTNTSYVGIGLNLLDGGMNYQDLMQLALNAKLGTGFTNDAEIKLLYQNLFGVTPSQADLSYWNGTLNSHQFTPASLAVMAADTAFNTTNINLVGLAQTGIEYT